MSAAETGQVPEPCAVVRARLQRSLEQLSHWYRLQLENQVMANSPWAAWFGRVLNEAWEAATAPLTHDYLQEDSGTEELLIMDQCPIGRPL